MAKTKQDLLNGYAKPKPAGQGGMVGTMNPEEMPQAKFGSHGGHRVLTTGDHPIDDHKPDLGHHKPRPGMSFFQEKLPTYFSFLVFQMVQSALKKQTMWKKWKGSRSRSAGTRTSLPVT